MDEEDANEPFHHLRGRARPTQGLTAAEFRRIEQTPEYLAGRGLITAAEYLAFFGDFRGPVLPIEKYQRDQASKFVGPPKPRTYILRKRATRKAVQS